jgi:hypothetical protein
LERLNRAGVIVRLHLESHSPAVADVDHARIFLAGFDQHALASGGEFLQLQPRILVAAVLAPHHREDAELSEIRLALEDTFDALVLLRREAVLGNDFGRDLRCTHGKAREHGESGLRGKHIVHRRTRGHNGSAEGGRKVGRFQVETR